MYFPYLRGRQYELLALRELLANNALSLNILPIIEPVKASSTLTLAMEAFIKANRKLGVILNPQVGSFEKELKNEKNASIKEKWDNALRDDHIVKFYHMTHSACSDLKLQAAQGLELGNVGAICTTIDGIRELENTFSSASPIYTLIPDESIFRRRIKNSRIMFADRFEKQTRNTDYADRIDEDFSADHLFFDADGFTGFSDYSVIGSEYSETGFAPYAVAIHIVYFDDFNNLKIHHFVSDTNDDITDPAGKFEEAARKLVEWSQDVPIKTIGLQNLISAYQNKKYPGLGTVKKYSIMHHLQLIGMFLDGEIS